jgi:hypothetical protein
MQIAIILIATISVLLSARISVAQQSGPVLWEHNGSIVYLVANGTERSFFYHEPRPGIAEQGVRTDTLLFRGTARGSTYAGTAFIFRRGCGSFPYQVTGTIYDNYERVVLEGRAPRVASNCAVIGYVSDQLEFILIKPSSSSATGPSMFQSFWTDSTDCKTNVGVTIMNGEISFWNRFIARGHKENEHYGSCDIRYVRTFSDKDLTVDYLNCDHPGHNKNNVTITMIDSNYIQTPQGKLFRCQ